MSLAPIYFDNDKNTRQDRSLLIFVEGTDDAHFLDVILKDAGADPGEVGVIVVGGTPKFTSAISMYKKSPFYKRSRGIAVIRDADENFSSAIASTNAVFNREFSFSVNHAQVEYSNSFRLGLFVLPGDGESGDLERLCLSTVEGSKLDVSAQKYINDVSGDSALSQVHKRKAQVFLAAIPNDLCRGAGMGFKKGFFDIGHDSVGPIKDFVKRFIANVEVVEAKPAEGM